MVDLPSTMVDLSNTMVDLPNTMVDLLNTMALFKEFMQASNNSCKFQKCKKHMDLVPYALVLCINETVRLKFPNHSRPS